MSDHVSVKKVDGKDSLAILGGTYLLQDRVVEDGGLYVEEGIIRAVGSRAEIESLRSAGSVVIDASGCTVMPGFIDAHAHPLSFGFSIQDKHNVRFPAVASIADLVSAVGRMTEGTPPGVWVRGRGFDYGKYPEGRMPTRWDIDPVSKENPVALVHSSGHFALVNSAALREAGIEDGIEDPEAGRFVRDEEGRVTGMLLDSAMEMVLSSAVNVAGHGPNHNAFPSPVDELVNDLEIGLSAFAAAGVTTVVDAQATSRDLPAYLAARDSGRMPIRVVAMYLSNHLEGLKSLGLAGPLGDRRFSTGALKIYSDGALTGSTALISQPYTTEPCSHGYPYWSQDALDALVSDAHGFGLQIGIHAQGDVAIEMCLNAYETALAGSPRQDHRHRLEHCGSPNEAQIARIRDMGAIPICQPNFLHEFGDSLRENLGEDRASKLTPLASLLKAGVPFALSSDAPVSSHRPLRNIQSAVLRRSLSGAGMGQEEEISIIDGLLAYTWNAARSIFRESWCGALLPGYVADIAILGADVRTVRKSDLAEVSVRYTLVDGRVVYSSTQDSSSSP